MRKQNHWKRNQKIAVLAAGSLLAQCVGVGIPVRAEIKHVEVSEGMTWERATASDAERIETNIASDEDKTENIDNPSDSIEILEKATLEKATPAQAERIASISLLASPGNLWENWPETTDFPGDGTEEVPYQINSLSRLLGFSRSVAEGNSYEGQFFELTRDLDLGGLNLNHGSWNPIGWYQNAEEMDGEIACGFRGTFDGAGHTIKGLKIADASRKLVNAGLFGWIDGGTVKNLEIKAANISGEGNMGILAGRITGNAVIYNVKVSGFVHGETGNAGGLAAVLEGDGERVTVENCRAENVVVNSEGQDSFTGGIAGAAKEADLVDCLVSTQNGTADRIRGKGYVGGMAGVMEDANLYNSYVNGTIGGNGSRAAGGIVGKYQGGSIVMARMAGEVARTYQGTAAREGTFVGTRDWADVFTYGIEKGDNLAYLFTNSSSKAKHVFGSVIDGDNIFMENAHIGYWTDHETRYTTISGEMEKRNPERYFYEELEDGIRSIITRRLGNEFSASGAAEDLRFRLDHFAPGYQGEPVEGYLLSVPRIDARNSNGTYDTDVAVLTAMPGSNQSYYRSIDKDHVAAVAPGVAVTVVTAPKNDEENRYQMVVDEKEPGGVLPPTYLDDNGQIQPMNYVSGGSYTFQMPSRDTEINVRYQKVTTRIQITPSDMIFHVVQTRSGDRKNPDVCTEVRTGEGVLIARYLNDVPDQSVEIQPVRIHGEHNSAGDTISRTMKWMVDDADLLQLAAEEGYTTEDARIIPRISSSFIQNIRKKQIKAQADSQYQEPISATIYKTSGVVTAMTDPDYSVGNQPVYGNCRVHVTFQIKDQTTRRVEGLDLNKRNLNFTITRVLSGDRKAPQEKYLCTGDTVLSASLIPEQPFYQNVTWKDQENGKNLRLSSMGTHGEECKVTVRYDEKGQEHPAWIQNVVNADDQKWQEDTYGKRSGGASYSETVTATSEDQTHGVITAQCQVTVNFRTLDQTVVYPESVAITPGQISFDLHVKKTGTRYAPVRVNQGFEPIQAAGIVKPVFSVDERPEGYHDQVQWSLSDDQCISVDSSGKLSPKPEALWITELLDGTAYGAVKEDQKTVWLTAKTVDQGLEAKIPVTLKLTVENQVQPIRSSTGGSSSGSSGGSSTRSSSGTTVSGTKNATSSVLPSYVVTGKWIQNAAGKWLFTDQKRTYVNEWAAVHNPYADTSKGQSAFDWFRFDKDGFMVTGWFTDKDGNRYYLSPVSDGTQGRMVTGWHTIDGRSYYFQEESNGTRGALREVQ